MSALQLVPDVAPVVVREAAPADVAFIADSWAWSYWDDRRRGRDGALLSRETFLAGQARTVQRLLARSTVLVACVPEVPDEICGYVVRDAATLHYVLVKRPYRDSGVCNVLLLAAGVAPTATVTVSHLTRLGFLALRKRHVIYNPHAREQCPQ